MKKNIHPVYFPKAKISCACGATYEMGATKEHLEVEICAACHPLYTGKTKLIDAAGRVERFRRKSAKAEEQKSKTTKRKTKKPIL